MLPCEAFFLGELKSHNLDTKSSGNLIHKKLMSTNAPASRRSMYMSCHVLWFFFFFSKKYFNRKTMTLFSSFTSAYVLAFNFLLNFFSK